MNESKRHSKCKGFIIDMGDLGTDYDCEYGGAVSCGECKYLLENDEIGKDPEEVNRLYDLREAGNE